MKQIRISTRNKKTTTIGRPPIYKLSMVRSVDKRWNLLYPDIMRLYRKLEVMEILPSAPDQGG